MIIESLTIEGFKSIYNKTTFDFTGTGMWKVSGDVGSGKSTIGEAVIFCLFGSVNNISIPDLISWGAKKCTADIDLVSIGRKIHIHRVIYKLQGRKSELFVTIDGEPMQYTNKRDGQQLLENTYYDISRQAVESLCIISFNGLKNITGFNLSYNETRDFVDDIFGLSVVNTYIDQCKNHLNDSQSLQDRLSTEIRTLTRQKTDYESKVRDLTSDTAKDSDIEELKKKKAELEKSLSELKLYYDGKIDIFNSLKSNISSDLAVLKSRGVTVAKNLELVRQGKCPVCGHTVEQDLIKSYEDEVIQLREDYSSKNASFKSVNKQISDATAEYNKESATKQKELKNIEYNINKIMFSHQSEVKNLNSLIFGLSEDIAAKQAEYDSVQIETAEWKQLYDILYKEGRQSVLKAYIPTLNQNINYYLQELKQPYSVRFDENFRCSINAFGASDIPVSSLSTGQGKTVNTAIIFGILKTLLNGVNFNIIFLDELICNMHEDLRNVTCEMIANNIKDKSIYIISHTPVDESLFKGEIKARLSYWEEDGRLIQNTEYTTKVFGNV